MNLHAIGVSSVKGIRKSNQDRYILMSPLSPSKAPGISLVGVFDGHNGSAVAEYLSREFDSVFLKFLVKSKNSLLPNRLLQPLKWIKSRYISPLYRCFGLSKSVESLSKCPYTLVIQKTCKLIDQKIYRKCSRSGDDSGSTAAVLIIDDTSLVSANVGDSRVLLCRNREIKQLSVDHKPSNEDEASFLRKRGALIVDSYILSHDLAGLAVSRAFGDISFKTPPSNFVTAVPYVMSVKRTVNDLFVIIASDGLFDVMTNDAAVASVTKYMMDWVANHGSASHDQNISFSNSVYSCHENDDIMKLAVDASRFLAEKAIELGSRDNVTVVLVFLADPFDFAQTNAG